MAGQVLEKRRKIHPTQAQGLIDVFLSGKSPHTIDAYRRDLRCFAAFLGARDVGEAAEAFLALSAGEANAFALTFRNHLRTDGLAPATVNRRLAALRSMVKLARMLGRVPWELEVPNVEHRGYRDTRGPGVDGYRALLGATSEADTEKGARDHAILRLLFDLGLRRSEVCQLDIEDLELDGARLWVRGKKRTEKEGRTLPAPTMAALEAWLSHRGREDGPLFHTLSRAHQGRLTPRGLFGVVRAWGRAAGVRVTPHGLRHAAITHALDITNGDVRAVQRFSRHRDLRTLQVYDDNRQDLGGQVAALVAAVA